MTAIPGLDSAYGPNATMALTLRAKYSWWGGYLGGPGAYRTWSPEEWNILHETGYWVLPIWVPSMGLTENAAQSARTALSALDACGLSGAICLDTESSMTSVPGVEFWVEEWVAEASRFERVVVYRGAYTGITPARSWSWIPLWGSDSVPASAQAIQYGPATLAGISVDIDAAGPDFPLATFKSPLRLTPSVPEPTPKQEEHPVSDPTPMSVWPRVVIATPPPIPGALNQSVVRGSVWLVWPSGYRTWVPTEDDVRTWCRLVGQAAPFPLSPVQLMKIPERSTGLP